ncbi:acyl-coenzyme A oxidase 4, peroxisomal [Arthrobacter sp. Hiyo4]|nr:acyl-coenzyme A oxidase 4, peroxisomal [Arthrobacter sp. Hiyo4]
MLPVIDGYWDRGDYPLHLVRRLGEADLLRDGLALEGFAPMSKMAAGLVNMEISRGDGSIGTIIAVQGGLAMRSIALCGSEEQKRKWLPALAKGEEYGAFALTEPTHGSDSVALETTATPTAGGVLLNGEKKWIGNGSVGGVTVVWARAEDGQVHGYLVPQDSAGYTATVIEGKVSLRAIWQAHIRLENVFVPAENVLPGANSFKDTSRVLLATRLGLRGPLWVMPLPATRRPCSTRRSASSSAGPWPPPKSFRND